MTQKLLLIIGGAVLMSTGFQAAKLTEYCNSRFDFCIQYPADFIAQGEAANGDGQRFLSKDKQAEIAAYGMNVLEELNDHVNEEFKMQTKGINVSYQVIKPNSFIFSGLDKEGKIIYQKTVMKKVKYEGEEEDTRLWQTLTITYPKSQQTKYASYCTIISRSLQ